MVVVGIGGGISVVVVVGGGGAIQYGAQLKLRLSAWG